MEQVAPIPLVTTISAINHALTCPNDGSCSDIQCLKKNLDAWNHFQQCKDPVCSEFYCRRWNHYQICLDAQCRYQCSEMRDPHLRESRREWSKRSIRAIHHAIMCGDLCKFERCPKYYNMVVHIDHCQDETSCQTRYCRNWKHFISCRNMECEMGCSTIRQELLLSWPSSTPPKVVSISCK